MVSTADLVKYTNGDMKDDNEFVIKTTLQFVNLLTNICKIRKDATESALRYLFTNNSNNNYEGLNNVTKQSSFVVGDSSTKDMPNCKRISAEVINEGSSKVRNVVTSEVSFDEFELGEFSISEEGGVINFDGELLYE